MKVENNDKRLMGTEEFADYCGITRWKLYDLVKEGKLRPITGMGKGWKFFASDFDGIELERI